MRSLLAWTIDFALLVGQAVKHLDLDLTTFQMDY